MGAYLCVFLGFLGRYSSYDYGCGGGPSLVAILVQ